MTKEQLEEELRPMEWERYWHDKSTIVAESRIHCNLYSIYKLDGLYAVAIMKYDGSNRAAIAVDIQTIEEAKTVAWNDYVNNVLNLFKKRS